MPKSFLVLEAPSAFAVAFPTYSESHRLPKLSGFAWDYDRSMWTTTDPLHVARLASKPDSVVEATVETIAEFDRLRPALPEAMRDVVLVAAAEPEAIARIFEKNRRADAEKRAAAEFADRETAAMVADRDLQVVGAQAPTGADVPILLRWDADRGFHVRHPRHGAFGSDLRDAQFHFSSGVWMCAEVQPVAYLASAVLLDHGPLPATLEAAREFASIDLRTLSHTQYPPRLVVVSTEADELARTDAKTMAHLEGASDEAIAAAYDAMKLLAADDRDKASRKNNVGFGQAHTKIGHRLATVEADRRTPYDDAFALKLARLHKGQLPAEIVSAVGSARG